MSATLLMFVQQFYRACTLSRFHVITANFALYFIHRLFVKEIYFEIFFHRYSGHITILELNISRVAFIVLLSCSVCRVRVTIHSVYIYTDILLLLINSGLTLGEALSYKVVKKLHQNLSQMHTKTGT